MHGISSVCYRMRKKSLFLSAKDFFFLVADDCFGHTDFRSY